MVAQVSPKLLELVRIQSPVPLNLIELRVDFIVALQDHEKQSLEPYSGPYHFLEQNVKIGKLIELIDPILKRCKKLHRGEYCRGNEHRLNLLNQIIEQE